MTAYKLVFVPSYFTKCCTSVGTSTFGMRHSADVQIYQAATRDGRHSMEHLRKQVKVDTYVMIKLTCWLTSCGFYNKSDIQLFVNELVIYDHFNLKSLGPVIIAGVMRCGPAPVKAVKNGAVYLPYDATFIFAEVNGDKVHWLVSLTKLFLDWWNFWEIRMHSSRMRTARSLPCGGGGGLPDRDPPDRDLTRTETPQTENLPPGERPPHHVTCNVCWDRDPPPPPVNTMTQRCWHITLPQTSFAGGNKDVTFVSWKFVFLFTLNRLKRMGPWNLLAKRLIQLVWRSVRKLLGSTGDMIWPTTTNIRKVKLTQQYKVLKVFHCLFRGIWIVQNWFCRFRRGKACC